MNTIDHTRLARAVLRLAIHDLSDSDPAIRARARGWLEYPWPMLRFWCSVAGINVGVFLRHAGKVMGDDAA